ncbi:MAG: hypothetical protein K6A36_05445 [Paludibacteraceae bacterium]|nr:hypothetical protein [Paludibacteraceae bacterium]
MNFLITVAWALLITLTIYYVTVVAHLFSELFGKNIPCRKVLIPFYGWVKWFSKD